MRQQTVQDTGLRRDVGLLGLTFVSLGSIIGSGWLLGAYYAGASAGPASVISWVLAGGLLALLALVHAELGAAYPVAGGTARFPQFAFGSLAGFTCGWMSWLGSAFIAPVEVEAALTYLNKKIPGMVHASGTLTPEGLAIASALMLAFTIVNIVGIRRMSDTNNMTVVWKLAIPVVTVVALLALAHHGSNFTHARGGFAPYGAKGVLAALPLGVVFAMQGFEQALQVGGEARNPQRDLARAVIISMIVGTVVYLLLEVAFIGSLNPKNLVHGWSAPFGKNVPPFGPYATLASALGAAWLAALLYADAFVSPAGTGLIYVGTSSRLSYALGRSRYLPPVLSKVSARGVPITSIIVSFVIGEVAFLPFPSWRSLVAVISSASALMYAFAPISLAALRKSDPDRERPYRLPMPRVICPLSFIAADLIVYWAGWSVLWKLYVGLGVGFVLFVANRVFTTSGKRPPIDRKAAVWLVPWLAGLAVITRFGQYAGGTMSIPFWWDIVVVAAFSLVIFAVAVRLASSPEDVRAAQADVDAESGEAAYPAEPTRRGEPARNGVR